jgi:predicted alpha/beta hydrolase family esterase
MVTSIMKNAVLIHGMPSKDEYFDPSAPSLSNAHWFPWLQKQLIINGVNTQTPDMPDSYKPDYEKWKKEFDRYDIGPQTLLVGHSAGAGFLLRWLSENKDARVGKLILVAPYIGTGPLGPRDFFLFTIDENLADRTNGLVIFNSNNDKSYIHSSVNELRNKLRGTMAKYRELHGYGHFTSDDMKSEKFPELLEACLDKS